MDERDAVSAQLLAVTSERDAALRRCRELTAALEVSSADGARARCAHMRTRHTSSPDHCVAGAEGTPQTIIMQRGHGRVCTAVSTYCLPLLVSRVQLGEKHIPAYE